MLLACLMLIPPAVFPNAQTVLVKEHFFPAELEFKELASVQSESSFSNPESLAEMAEGSLIAEVGFAKCDRRIYSTVDGGSIMIEVLTLTDARGAYSLLTLLGAGEVVNGPPGAFFSLDASGIVFAQGQFCVRIRSAGQADLVKRVAVSVSNRIGNRGTTVPLLISHFPPGCDPSSLRYFLGPKALESRGGPLTGKFTGFGSDVEIAQAKYTFQDQSGVLSLIAFPTSQLAEEYFDALADLTEKAKNTKIYTKKAGPLLGILEGGFDTKNAERLLSTVRFTYSIRWIYDKHSRSNATIWGVPVGLLGTVVRSLALTAVLCFMSVIAGAAFAIFRILLRGYAPGNIFDNPDRTGMIRLKINED